MNVRELLFFDSMVTPKIITFIYWLLLAAAVLGGLSTVVTAFGMFRYNGWAGFGMLVVSPFVVILGVLVARIYCEIMIVLFKINEALQDIRRKP
ncbi:hypothetical protein ABB34_11485 [Stenotrophomonas daejeonensis]|jgi:hypothetical protein|uniref:Transmembrane protein n=1 Tax=Stenotrophomonas daejeonensis TaxID=659018 RepID=A0A0R0DZW4_9GAMM|nr:MULTISPECIES: DUF4282 domain-containing protein [Stenotrophomonas]KRG83633.1 hypothetical protein ABB34_11485 [Stenotrophomonas daejeonensis]MCG8276061.1 DUF4282 domain-containing protein [Stenotrophomonas sp. NLF4-10]